MRGAIPPIAVYTFTLPLHFGYFADLTVPVVSCPLIPDYHPAVAIKFSLFLVIISHTHTHTHTHT
jgi:hypothetical protein